MKSQKYYITTTLPYVNAEPHIGFALELVQADVLARYKRQRGYDVFFNFGTDEHGLKVYKKALEAGIEPKNFCDGLVGKFKSLVKALDISNTHFIRTTDSHHEKAAQEMWKRCWKSGDIYKKRYKAKYCVGCELYITDSELVGGRCPIHPTTNIEIIEEENYFFRFSRYREKLLDMYKKNSDFVVPESRFNEIKSFVERGLDDFSISRLKSKMPWGVEVPGDKDHVMYVWFDALVNYISTLGWPDNTEAFANWWPGFQIAGKDNLRQQCAIWQAMLLSAGLPTSRQIFIHGFITANGQKISKSLGNVVSPFDVVKKFGVDAVRYYLLREIPSYGDGDYSERRFKEVYNADLANNLGNLVSRVFSLSKKYNVYCSSGIIKRIEIGKYLESYQFDKALEFIWSHITLMNKYLDENAPWKKEEREASLIVEKLIRGSDNFCGILGLSDALYPFLPETAEKIRIIFTCKEKVLSNSLFPRLI